MTKILLDKYGGSSLRNHESTALTMQEGKRQLDQGYRLVEVVSAPGKYRDQGVKMTDRVREGLLKYILSGEFPRSSVDDIKQHFYEIYTPFGLSPSEVDQSVEKILFNRIKRFPPETGNPDLRAPKNMACYAALLSAPESLNAELRVKAYQKMGIPAFVLDPQENIFCDGDLLNAHYLHDVSIPKIQAAFERGHGIAVRPGFQGVTRNGKIALFPRGGSDITGAIDAEALKVELYRNCTDVHGVKQVDPRLFADDPGKQKQIQTIPQLSYQEVEELAISGASVIHPLAIAPLLRAKIPMRICNTFDLNGPSTLISKESQQKPAIKGLAYLKGLGYLVLHSPAMIGEPGYLEKFSEAFRRYNVDVEMVFTSPTIIAANTKEVEKLPLVVEALEEYGNVYSGHDTGMISIVGSGYLGNPRYAIRFLSALLQDDGRHIPIRRQTQAMDCSYWISVDEPHVEPLARKIFDRFFGPASQQSIQVEC